ncbi:MAG: xanthine dehydrogenase accessory protein XdhC, partial [Haliea sp.]
LGSRGSTPRDSGTKMLVGENGTFCSIGGGHLEYKAIELARVMLGKPDADQRIEHFPLGPRLGQCCGGSATVLFESFPGSRVNLMLFGAGHVGKALVTILGQLPCRVQWVDSREEQFPESLPDNVSAVISEAPEMEVESMPANSYYLVMTHNHQLDFAISEAVLKRGDARYIGLIGSSTKWQRFQMRFERRGFDRADYQTLRCPVGLETVPGKLPMEVATSIAGELIAEYQRDLPLPRTQRGVNWRELKEVVAGRSESLPPMAGVGEKAVEKSSHE